jgi:hypothetical protein
VTIAPALVAYLLLVAGIVHDWRKLGPPHPVHVHGGLALVAVKLLNWLISVTPAWHAFAGGLLAMAQQSWSYTLDLALSPPGEGETFLVAAARSLQLRQVSPPSTTSSIPVT